MVIDTSRLGAGSWKTTASGLVTAAAGFIVANPELFVNHQMLLKLAMYMMVGGLASIGLFAKDSNVTGGTTLQSNAVPDATLHAEAKVEAANVKP